MKRSIRGLKEKSENQFDFKEVIDLGFKVIAQGSDPIYQDQFGCDYMIVQLTIPLKNKEELSFNWDQETREVEVLRCKKDGADILAAFMIESYEELENLIYLMKGSAPRLEEVQGDLPQYA